MKIFNLPLLFRFCIAGLIAFSLLQCKNSEKEKPDNKGHETKTKTEQPVKNENKREKPTLIHDDKGNIIERHSNSYSSKDGSILSKESYYYKYDDRNNVIEETKESYDTKGELKYKNVNFYTYNDKNQRTEIKFLSYDGNLDLQRQARNTFKYNENGHLIEEIGYFADGSIKSKTIRNPNEKGEILSEEFINYNKDGTKKDHKKYYYTKYGLERTEDLMDK